MRAYRSEAQGAVRNRTASRADAHYPCSCTAHAASGPRASLLAVEHLSVVLRVDREHPLHVGPRPGWEGRAECAQGVRQSGGEDEQQRVNARLREEIGRYADALADLGADLTIGPADAATNRAYFQRDGIHPTVAGHAVIAAIVQRVIWAL